MMKSNKYRMLMFLIINSFIIFDAQLMANEMEQAAIETDAQFRSVVDSVEQTKQWMESAQKKLSEAGKLANRLPLIERQKARKAIASMKISLSKHMRTFSTFGKSAGKVTNVLDYASQIKEIQQIAQNRQGGPLAYQMSVLNSIFSKTEGLNKIPIIGDILSGYNDAVGGLLNATDKVANSLDENRKQGMVGTGVPNYLYDPKYIAMKKQFGQSVADGNTWIPEGPSFVYRNSIDKNKGQVMIWDARDNEWYKIDNGSINIEGLYANGLKIGKRFSPYELKKHSQEWSKLSQRKENADKLFDKLKRISHPFNADHEAFEQLDIETQSKLRHLLKDKELFRIWYSLDIDKFQFVNLSKSILKQKVKVLKKKRKEEIKKKAAKRLAKNKNKANKKSKTSREIVDWIDHKHGINAPLSEPADNKQARASVDCKQLPEHMVDAIHKRLSSSSASEVASMSLKVLDKGERQSLMNCLCAATSKQSGSVSKYYEPKPVNASPSCNDPARGSCVNQGMGCSRHPLRITSDSLKSCNSGYRVAKRLCEQGVR